jgi:hypothetical protein
LHPGAIAETNLSRHMDPGVLAELRTSGAYRYKTIEQGAATSVVVATSPLLDGIGGRYFEDGNQAAVIDSDAADLSDHTRGVAPYAVDPANAERLWTVSEALLAG